MLRSHRCISTTILSLLLLGTLFAPLPAEGSSRARTVSRGSPAVAPPQDDPAADRPSRFEVAEGVWAFIPAGGGSTATVITGNGEALVVDPHSTADQARALAAEIRRLGDVRVRWIVNSHWHQDHHGGTAGLLEIWPEARVLRDPRAAEGVAIQASMERSMMASMSGREAYGETVFPPAHILVERPLVLHVGGRRVEVRPVGPAHTEGDLYVWLPEIAVLVAGDLLTSPYVVPRSGYPRSYAGVLRQLDRVPFRVLIPGHGAPVEDGHERLVTMAELLDAVTDVVDRELDARPRADRGTIVPVAQADPVVQGFEGRIDWDEEHAMRFLDFPSLVEMIAVRAMQERGRAYAGTEITAGYLPIPGARVFYESMGSGEPLVLIHGGFMDRRMWDPQLAAFAAAGYRVIRYDLPGFGRTIIADPSMPRSDSADLAAVLDGLDVEAAHVVGLSMGGTVAIDFAVDHPDRVRSLVAAETRPSGMALPEARMEEMMAIFELAGQGRRQEAIEALLADPLFASAEDNSEARDKIRLLIRENFAIPSIHQAEAPPAVDRLDRIDAPTLLIQGAPVGEEAGRIAALMRDGIRDLRVESIPDAGHMLNLESPERFNELVLGFLEER